MTKELLPHQVDCLERLCAGLREAGRSQAQLACGSGKTLIGLRLAERLCPGPRVLILVQAPTLELLDQLSTEWKMDKLNDGWDLAGVGGRLGDYPASTNPDEIAEWMERCPQLVLFSTYHSSGCIQEAQKICGRGFDLAIFDEAHRTTQKEDAAFAICLEESNVKIQNRVFLTATPRHIIEERGESQYYSMDDESSYGKRAYSLSLNRAVESNIVCHYRVLVPILRGGDRSRLDEGVWPPAQIAALERTIADWKVRKIITFHSTIDDCTSFVEAWNGTRSEDDSLFAVAIHSRMSPAKRALALAHFAREKGCILSNPHLLSEGINVPSTDMAVLLCNMQSPIRVAQILGRVLRKDPANPRKRVGYLMVPIFASDSGEVADVQEEAALGPLWDVLECLLEQTEGFEKLEKRSDFEAAINDMMENVEFIDPWGEIQRPEIDRLRERISVRWVERLTTRWDDQFEELRRFKDAYGHAHVTAEDGKTSKRVNRWHGLAGWARRQRDAFEGRTLRADRQRRLEREGFVFRSSETTKDEANRMEWLHLSKTIGTLALPNRYGLLPAPWAHRHLTCEVVADLRTDWPEKYAEECERFALICQWAARIRRNATSAERQQLLGLGFIFNAQEALAKFRTQNDRVEIPVWLEHLHTREKIIYPSTV